MHQLHRRERISFSDVQKAVKTLRQTLHQEAVEIGEQSITCEKKNEAFTTSGQVQYVAQTGNFRKKGFAYSVL